MNNQPEVEPSMPLQLSIATLTYANYGDHAQRDHTFHELVPGETVEELVYRLFRGLSSPIHRHDDNDEIVIKVVVGADGEPTGKKYPSKSESWGP